MSMYEVTVYDREGTVWTSSVSGSLAAAAQAMLHYAVLAHDVEPAKLLDVDGEATVRVRGMGERELNPDEKRQFVALLAEFGGEKLDDDGPAGTWSAPGPEELI